MSAFPLAHPSTQAAASPDRPSVLVPGPPELPRSYWYIPPNYYFVQPFTVEGEKIRGREEKAETSIMKFLNHRAPAVNIFPASKSIKYCFIPQLISNVYLYYNIWTR